MVKKDLIFHWLQKCKKVDLYVAIFLPTNSAYRREFDETNCISFLIKDYELLENSMKFGKKAKVSKTNLIVNQYTVKKYLKAKIKSYNSKINTNFHFLEKVLNFFVYQ